MDLIESAIAKAIEGEQPSFAGWNLPQLQRFAAAASGAISEAAAYGRTTSKAAGGRGFVTLEEVFDNGTPEDVAAWVAGLQIELVDLTLTCVEAKGKSIMLPPELLDCENAVDIAERLGDQVLGNRTQVGRQQLRELVEATILWCGVMFSACPAFPDAPADDEDGGDDEG